MSPDDVDRIRRALADGLVAAARYVPDEWVLPFVISGTVEQCAAELVELTTVHGIDEFMIPVFDVHTGAALLEIAAQALAVS